jgi:branched-chain amino acid transport system ATP-binding protein
MTLLETPLPQLPLLRTQGLTRRYAGLVAVDHVDLVVPQGGVHAVIGPNGAGKTTLFNLLSGLVTPSEGSITFAGTDITAQPAHRRATLGMARTFQNIRIFGAMTVLENVLTGLHPSLGSSLGAVIFRLPTFRAEERKAVAAARAALDLVGLSARTDDPAASLAYGDQRRLEIARAMAQSPRLLLLDEPAAGMNPAETVALGELVKRIAEGLTTVLLVEHDMGFVMRLSDTVTVLNFGCQIFAGTPAAVRSEPSVVEAYLGARLAAKLQAQHG